MLDEVFGETNFVNTIIVKKKSSTLQTEAVHDYVLWYARKREMLKHRVLYGSRDFFDDKSRFKSVVDIYGDIEKFSPDKHEYDLSSGELKLANDDYPLVSQHPHERRSQPYNYRGEWKKPGVNRQWTFDPITQIPRLEYAYRLRPTISTLRGIIYQSDSSLESINNIWHFHGESQPIYVVQTNKGIVERCILMTTDPGDLVLDPTCGSATAAYEAEQWGRRWITIDTSRVALALARARIMGARYAFYLLVDSPDGQRKEAEITRKAPDETQTNNNIRQGFVYERVPHITLKSIANNAEIDVIWEKFQEKLESMRQKLNKALGKKWEEWEIPHDAEEKWSAEAKKNHAQWWQKRIARQKEIDASIAAKADFEYLYDKPYEDRKKVRVAGPFTVESLSPHRVLGVDENDELIDPLAEPQAGYGEEQEFVRMILENLKTAGVQQAHKEDKINFTSLTPWPGKYICAEGRYTEGEEDAVEKRAAIFIGPEFGTVSRPDLVTAGREAGDADFDVLITCAFNWGFRFQNRTSAQGLIWSGIATGSNFRVYLRYCSRFLDGSDIKNLGWKRDSELFQYRFRLVFQLI